MLLLTCTPLMDTGTQHASFNFLYAMHNCYFLLFLTKAQLLFIIDLLWYLLFFCQTAGRLQGTEGQIVTCHTIRFSYGMVFKI